MHNKFSYFFFLSIQAYLNGLRFVLTVLGGTISVMGSRTIGYPSAGALGCMTIAFFAGIGWKGQQQHLTPQQLQRQLENENVSFYGSTQANFLISHKKK